MEIRIEFEYGPIRAEIDSDADESYDGVLAELASFIEDHDEIFGEVDISDGQNSDSTSDAGESGDGEQEVDDSDWGSLIAETGVSETMLKNMFEVRGEYPQLLVGEHVTGSKNDQMEEGALFLLIVWEDYYGSESLTSSEIKECLRNAGLAHENFYNIYQRQSFSQMFVKEEVEREDGGTAYQLSLTQPGRNHAYDRVSEIADEIENG